MVGPSKSTWPDHSVVVDLSKNFSSFHVNPWLLYFSFSFYRFFFFLFVGLSVGWLISLFFSFFKNLVPLITRLAVGRNEGALCKRPFTGRQPPFLCWIQVVVFVVVVVSHFMSVLFYVRSINQFTVFVSIEPAQTLESSLSRLHCWLVMIALPFSFYSPFRMSTQKEEKLSFGSG